MKEGLLEETAKVLLKVDEKQIALAVDLLFDCWKEKVTVYIFGNGGSAATSSHFSSDLIKWASNFTLRSICLSDNVPLLTAIANDLGFGMIFYSQLLNLRSFDLVVAFSVHGGRIFSDNLTRAFRLAEEKNVGRISFTGHDGGKLKELSTVNINVPSESTPIIEGLHSVLAHVVVEELRKRIEGESK